MNEVSLYKEELRFYESVGEGMTREAPPNCLRQAFMVLELISSVPTFNPLSDASNMYLRLFSALSVALIIAMPGTGLAQTAYPTIELLSTAKTVLGEELRYPTSGPAHITASIVTIVPGGDSLMHRHPAPMVAYILDGEVTVDYGPAGRKVFRKGEALVEAMDVPHRGMNLGSEPVRILSIHVGAEGTANIKIEK